MKVAVLKETFPGERRVAMVPANVTQLIKAGCEVLVESGAGVAAGFSDAQYQAKGATLVDRHQAFQADVLLQVRTLGANQAAGRDDLPRLRRDQIVIGMSDPLSASHAVREFAVTGATLFALELIPRITRAQSMDVLSSMATIAGYRAVLLAAVELPKMFPMLMTAAGTVTAAKVFVIGAGVAGLQAISAARRLGAVVQAWDVRPDCREQVESLGGKFVDLQLTTTDAQDKGGYAKDLGEDFYRRQREAMAKVIALCDVVISTAAIPGKPSPLLITKEAVAGMQPGSVVVDLAAERGGNCELSQADKRVLQHGVTLLAPTNLPSEIPYHASQMFSNNITKFLLNMVKQGAVQLDLEDEIIRGTLIAYGGEVVHPRLLEIYGTPIIQA
jgi:NAD(P) transhydrogenase subunit alpha